MFGSTVTVSRSDTCARSVRPALTPSSPRGTGRSWRRCLAFHRRPPGFLADLGLRSQARIGAAAARALAGLPGAALTELAVRSEELAQLTVEPRVAVIVENEISYLSVDVPEDGVVFWGKGFEVDRVGRLRWLAEADVLYWGDIDTHGFAILDRLRAWLPRARSLLMDRDTLLAHRDRWVTRRPPCEVGPDATDADEYDLYSELVEDGLGERVRLEQERIDWHWVERRLPAAHRGRI